MKTIFWNVDTQKDFMNQGWALPIPNADEIKPNLKLLTQYAKRNGIYVVNTGDWHNKKSEEISDTPDYVNIFPRHCMIQTPGAEFISETQPKNPYIIDWRDSGFNSKDILENRNLVLYKDRFSVFEGNKHTDKVLKVLAPERIIVYGVATDVCVKQVVFGLTERGYETYLVYDATKGVKPGTTSEALEDMAVAGARFVSTKEVLEGRLE
jgi:nicotinamidase/pyrazinamidase